MGIKGPKIVVILWTFLNCVVRTVVFSLLAEMFLTLSSPWHLLQLTCSQPRGCSGSVCSSDQHSEQGTLFYFTHYNAMLSCLLLFVSSHTAINGLILFLLDHSKKTIGRFEMLVKLYYNVMLNAASVAQQVTSDLLTLPDIKLNRSLSTRALELQVV